MFFQGCGSDQSAVPRGTVELCQKLGENLAAAVEAVLEKPMRPVAPKFRAAFEFVSLDSGVWVTGYANDVMAYIPSRRLWEEGGYQAGAFEVYGLPATRWCPDIEDR